MTLNTSFANPFEIPPLKGLEDRYNAMNEVDPEKAYHSPDLYAVWSSKTFFLREALLNMQAIGLNVEYVFWNDAGSFREEQDFNRWPALERVEEVFSAGAEISGLPKDELFFIPLWDVPKEPLRNWTPLEGPKEYENSVSEGSFFGGRPNVIHWWYKTYWAYHDYYIFQLDKFAGKDQVVFNGLFMLYPKRFITVWQYDWEYELFKNAPEGPLGECGGVWWYYQFFLASDSERERMRRVWTPSYRTSPKFPDRPPAVDGVESKACRVSRVLWMESVMRFKWGNDWQPPHTPVNIDTSYRD